MNRIKIYIGLALILTSFLLFYYYDDDQLEAFGNYGRRYRRRYNRRHGGRRRQYGRFNPYYNYYNYYNYNEPMHWYDYLSPWAQYYYWRRPYNYSQVSPILE